MSDLKVARGFTLPRAYLTKTAAILAKKRIGKTYNASVIAEEFVAAQMPFVVLDPTSAWWGMRADKSGERDGLPVTIIGGEHGDLPLDVGSGKAIADLVVEEPGFYIVDLGHWENDSEHRRWAAPFLDRIYRRKAKVRDPVHLFIDEADVFAPQKPQKGDEQMLHNMQAIVRRGGIRGLGTTLITQRAAVLNKDVLTQLDLLIILRTIAPQDQNAVEDYVKRGASEHRGEIMASLASLKPGEAWIYGPGEEPPITERVQFRERHTFNSSATPEEGDIVEPTRMAPVAIDKARERLAEAIERQKAEDPKALQAEVRKLKTRIRELESAVSDEKDGSYEAGYEAGYAKHAELPPEEREVLVAPPGLRTLLDDTASMFEREAVHLHDLASGLPEQTGEAERVQNFGAEGGQRRRPRGEERQPGAAPVRDRREPRRDGSAGNAGGGRSTRPAASASSNGQMSGPQQRVLDAIAWLHEVGFREPTKLQVGFIAGYRVGKKVGGTYGNILGQLRSEGLIDYVQSNVVLTDGGRRVATPPDIEQTTAGLQAAIFARLAEPEQRVLRGIIDVYPEALTKREAGERAGYSVGEKVGGTFGNILGRLRSLGLIDYPAAGLVAAEEILFLD